MSLFKDASLLIVPSAYKAGKIYAVKPTDGTGDLTWTRGSDAWRTNAEGLVQRVPWNLLTYSNTFSNAAWVKYGVGTGTAASVTSGFTDPNGGSNAWRLQCNLNGGTTTSDRSYIYQSGISGTPFLAAKSIWIKNNTANAVTLFVGVNSSLDSVTIAASADWQRIKIEGGTINNEFRVGTMGGASLSNAVDILIYGAQLVEGSSAQTYFPTTDRLNVPRFDYTYGTCPAALLEPQRTNLLVRSNEFSNVGVWVTTNLTVSDNSQTGIDGNTTASLITTTSTFNLLNQQVSVTAGTVYTFSFYVKRGTMTDMKYRVRNVTGASDIIPPTSYYSQTNSSTFTRISVTITAPVGCLAITFYPFSDTGSIGTAILTQAQVEVGAYATTIIPTTSAQATRIADTATKTDISSLIGQSEGVMFAEVSGLSNDTVRLAISDGTNNNNIYIELSSGAISTVGRVSGINQFAISSSQTITNLNKIAVKYKQNDFALWINGVKVGTDTSGSTYSANTLNAVKFDRGDGFVPFYGHIEQMILFTTALTDSQLVALTT